MADREVVDQRIEAAVDELDGIIRRIRTTIFELGPAQLGGRSLRREVLDVCAEAARGLGFDPEVRLDGPVDTVADERIVEHAVAALREMLANVARHAEARSAEVEVEAADGRLVDRGSPTTVVASATSAPAAGASPTSGPGPRRSAAAFTLAGPGRPAAGPSPAGRCRRRARRRRRSRAGGR